MYGKALNQSETNKLQNYANFLSSFEHPDQESKLITKTKIKRNKSDHFAQTTPDLEIQIPWISAHSTIPLLLSFISVLGFCICT